MFFTWDKLFNSYNHMKNSIYLYKRGYFESNHCFIYLKFIKILKYTFKFVE